MTAPAYNVLTHANAYLLSDSPVKLDDAATLAPVTPDSIKADLANALTILTVDVEHAPSLSIASAVDRLRSALAKVDDLLADQRAMRASLLGTQQELDALRQQRLTIQGHALDIENATAALLSEIRNR